MNPRESEVVYAVRYTLLLNAAARLHARDINNGRFERFRAKLKISIHLAVRRLRSNCVGISDFYCFASLILGDLYNRPCNQVSLFMFLIHGHGILSTWCPILFMNAGGRKFSCYTATIMSAIYSTTADFTLHNERHAIGICIVDRPKQAITDYK